MSVISSERMRMLVYDIARTSCAKLCRIFQRISRASVFFFFFFRNYVHRELSWNVLYKPHHVHPCALLEPRHTQRCQMCVRGLVVLNRTIRRSSSSSLTCCFGKEQRHVQVQGPAHPRSFLCSTQFKATVP